MSIAANEVQFLTNAQQRKIRRSTKTAAQLARFYGVKVATINKVRGYVRVRLVGGGSGGGFGGGGGGGRAASGHIPVAQLGSTYSVTRGFASGTVTKSQGEPKQVAPPGALPLHVEGGPDLPQPLR